ncbi:MAG: nucleotidyltransferase family protein [Desulfococcaceae bacterium]
MRDDFRPESDVDVLVEFEPDARVGMIGLAGMELELDEILGRRVELHTSRGLNPHFRNEVLERAEGIHGRSLLQPTQCRRSLLPRR